MRNAKWISAYQIDQWADAIDARSLLPELIRRLVHATVAQSQLEHIEFAGSEEGQRPGYDGTTMVRGGGGNAKVPEGITYWEMGANQDIKGKLDDDFDGRVQNRAPGDYSKVTYIGITPRDYQKKGDWITEKKKLGHWGDVRVYDSNDLELWLETAPAVALWLLPHVRKQNIGSLLDLSSHWENLQRRLKGKLVPDILLTSREGATKEFERWLAAPCSVLAMRGQTPQEIVDVFSAWVQSLPQDKQEPIASRAIVVDDEVAWALLIDSPNPLILICGDKLQMEPEKIAAAQRKKHHVLRPVTGTIARDAFQLERMDRQELGKRLIAAGMLESEAMSLASNSGGWFSVLKRQYSSIPDDRDPAWANAPAAGELAPLLLIGAWTDANTADQGVIATVTARLYGASRSAVTHWSKQPDAPVRWGNGVWEFISLIDAWTYLHKTIEPAHLDEFENAAVKVLGVDNPALDLPAEERWQASIKGKQLEHSMELRAAIARSLAMLATREWPNDITDTVSLQIRVDRTVRKILPATSSWKRWSSLGGLLPSLAEAAPEIVLEAVENGIAGEKPVLRELFDQERGGAMGSVEHTGLLWALERMAWDKKLLPRVSLALARLAEIDPGGQWSNRPKESLHHVFFSWMPHTAASLDERVGVLKLLFQRHANIAWKLTLGLFPKTHSSIMVQRTPEWRFWAEGWKREMSGGEYEQSIAAFIDLALTELAKNPGRWASLVEDFPSLGRKGVERFLQALEAVEIETLNPEDREALWNQTRKLANHHREFADAKWAYPKDIVDRFDAVAQRLAPADPIELALPLFSHRFNLIAPRDMPWDEREKLQSQQRQDALTAIVKDAGLDGVFVLLSKAENTWAVGWDLAKSSRRQFDAKIIPELLTSGDSLKRKFAEAYATAQIYENVPEARKTTFSEWGPDQISAFVALLPFDRETWSQVAQFPEAIAIEYWKRTERQAFDLPSVDVEFAAKKLISIGRVHSAIDIIGMTRDKPQGKLKADVLMSLLELIAKTPSTERPGQLTSYHIQELINDIQKSPSVDEGRLAALEWAFLDLLDRHSRHRPEALNKALATQPKFFVELLCVLYRKRGAEDAEPTPSADAKAKAERAWNLLHDWEKIPGTQSDGTVSLVDLQSWTNEAREIAEEKGRLAVADITIGNVFAHAPSDPDGTWPCATVQQIIEETSSSEMERGFLTGIFNNRGITTRALGEGGDQERKLAKKYSVLADKVSLRFPKVSKLLNTIAADYEAQAIREDLEAAERD